MCGTLLRHWCWRYIKLIGMVLALVTAVAFLVDFLDYARRAHGLPGYSIRSGLTLSALNMPTTIESIIAFVVQIAAIALLSTAARKRELVIYRGMGISAFQALWPLCAITLAVGVFSVTCLDPLAIRTISLAQDVKAEIKGAHGAISGSDTSLWIVRQQENDEWLLLGVGNRSHSGDALADVTYVRTGPDLKMQERLDAPAASIANGDLIFRSPVRSVGDQSEVDQLREYSVRLPFEAQVLKSHLDDPSEIAVFQLPHAISLAKAMGRSVNLMRVRLYSLLCFPMLLVGMILLSAPIAMRFERTGRFAFMIISTILLGYGVYVVTIATRSLGAGGVIAPALAAGIPAILSIGLGSWWLLMAEDG